MFRPRAALALSLALAACGGSDARPPVAPDDFADPTGRAAGRAPAPPLTLSVGGAYVESTLRLDFVADGQRRPAGDAFEDPRLWWVAARVDGRALNKLLISPAHVSREETEVPRVWNVHLEFSVYVELPPVGSVIEVEVRPPHVAEIEKFEVRPDPPPPPVDPASMPATVGAPAALGTPAGPSATVAAAPEPEVKAKTSAKTKTKAKAKAKAKAKKVKKKDRP